MTSAVLGFGARTKGKTDLNPALLVKETGKGNQGANWCCVWGLW